MSVMTRFYRIFKADLHGVMDQMEDKKLLLKQHLREMEAALDRKREELAGRTAVLEQYREGEARSRTEAERLRQDIVTALVKDKEGIARQLIRKQLALTHHLTELARLQEQQAQETGKLSEQLAEQERQYDRVRLQATTYLRRTESREFPWDHIFNEPEISDEEVELALLKYKETSTAGGTAP